MWFENGQKWGEGNYKDGKKDGFWTEWFENGENIFEENYRNGRLIK